MLHLPLPLGGSEAITQPTPKLVVSPLRTMQRREHFANHFPICGYVVIASYARHCAPQQKAGEKCRNRSFASLLAPRPDVHVRFTSNSDRLLRRREMTLCANTDQSAVQQKTPIRSPRRRGRACPFDLSRGGIAS